MTSTTISRRLRKGVGRVALLAGVVALSGCLGPTYGTGKSQTEMLFDDLNNVVSLGTVGDSEPIAYTDRQQVQIPENTSVLPPPRAAAAQPETPKQRRQRIQQAAYDGEGAVPAAEMTRGNPYANQEYLAKTRGDGYDFNDRSTRDDSDVLSPGELRSRSELYRQRIAENSAANQTRRRFLSEPPLDYRRPSANAPVGDPGVDEDVKQRRVKGSESVLSKVGDLLPF